MKKNDILLAYGADPRALAHAVLQAAHIEEMIPGPAARIGLKPNLVTANDASTGATTHPELVAGAIEYLQEHGFENLVILEGSWVGDRTARAFEQCGYRELSRRYGVTLIDTQKDRAERRNCVGLPIEICKSALEVEFLINMPVMKGHCQTAVTCALKNLKGLIPNAEKRRFHSMGLHKPIAHLGAYIKQGFILVDAICGDLDFEEGGNPVTRNMAMGCLDPVLCDAYVCSQLGYSVDEIEYVGLAESLGAGCADLSKANVIQVNRPEAGMRRATPTGRVRALARYAQPKDACSACYGNLIHALNRLDERGALYNFKGGIAIGQGWRGQNAALGVGSCCKNCDQCVEGCPPSAEQMLRFLEEAIR